jgi:hypothetical protein
VDASQWLSCNDPSLVHRKLVASQSYGAFACSRKLRLFAVACARQVEHLMEDKRSREALEVAERYVNGLAPEAELKASRVAAWQASFSASHPAAARAAAWAVECSGHAAASHTSSHAAQAAASRATSRGALGAAGDAAWRAGRKRQAALVRDIFGFPFRPAPTVSPAWLAWRYGCVPKMARSIFCERRFADLPILADALEDAGCADAAILFHCRSHGEHVPGCWALDLLIDHGRGLRIKRPNVVGALEASPGAPAWPLGRRVYGAAPEDLNDEADMTPAKSLGACRAMLGYMLCWMAALLTLAALLCWRTITGGW